LNKITFQLFPTWQSLLTCTQIAEEKAKAPLLNLTSSKAGSLQRTVIKRQKTRQTQFEVSSFQ
jgi:hypothetical protein